MISRNFSVCLDMNRYEISSKWLIALFVDKNEKFNENKYSINF